MTQDYKACICLQFLQVKMVSPRTGCVTCGSKPGRGRTGAKEKSPSPAESRHNNLDECVEREEVTVMTVKNDSGAIDVSEDISADGNDSNDSQ